jgi:sialate O-acetylesterase
MNTPSAIRLPTFIGNGMVLQRGAPVIIHGWAPEGTRVDIEFSGQKKTANTGADGRWAVTLEPLSPGGPFVMNVNEIVLSDVWVGDVWIASGQSNMELPLSRTTPWETDMLDHPDSPAIRQFCAPVQFDFAGPREDIPGGRWIGADTADIVNFSGVAFHFARELYRKNGVPVGILLTASGGSPAQAWLGEQSLGDLPDYLAEYRQCTATDTTKYLEDENARLNAWYADVAARDALLAEVRSGHTTNGGDAGWRPYYVPSKWKDTEIGDIYGAVWFRKTFTVDAEHAGQPARLRLGCMVDGDETWINGVYVGSTGYQYPPRRYSIPAGVLRAGENTLLVRIVSPEGNGGFVPDKPYRIEFPDATIDLRGKFEYRIGAIAGRRPGQTFFQYKTGALYNVFVAPLSRYAVTGVIWYQGESNTGKTDDYEKIFTRLIDSWRETQKTPDMAFLFAQLPIFMDPSPIMQESGWAEIRDAQRRSLSLPKTAMAVTLDLGEWNDLHPVNKHGVGTRLALASRAVAYGETKLEYSGPLYESHKIEGNHIRVTFSHVGSGLATIDGRPLAHFAIRGEDGKWLPATAHIDGDSVLVGNPNVGSPVAVRYAWADNPEGANLCNRELLRASSFETD